MTRLDAVRALRAGAPARSLIVTCNGMVGRELYTAGDRPEHFYMIGSMGLAASIGLGVAMTRGDRTVVVADGDGNVLMGMGALASVAAAKPPNFYHVVFDNAAHASTGGQRTIADRVPLERVAEAAGYAKARRWNQVEALDEAYRWLFAGAGPAMLVVPVEGGNVPGVARVEIPPPDLARRFRTAVLEGR